MSVGGKKTSSSTEQETQQSQSGFSLSTLVDPQAQAGLDQIFGTAAGLADAPLAADLSPQTLSAIDQLGIGTGRDIGKNVASTLRGFLKDDFQEGDFGDGGEFREGGDLSTRGFRSGDPLSEREFTEGEFTEGEFREADPFDAERSREALDRAASFAAEFAEGQVSDVFTAGGRTGSQAQAKAVAQGVAGAVAPLAFAFESDQLRRQDEFEARQEGRLDEFDARETASLRSFEARELARVDDFNLTEAARSDRSAEVELARRDEFDRGQEQRTDAERSREIARRDLFDREALSRQDNITQAELLRRDQNQALKITTAFGLQDIRTAQDAQLLQEKLAALHAGGLIDDNTLRQLEEPFKRLGLLSSSILGAIDASDQLTITGAEGESSATGSSKGKSFGFSADIISPKPVG